MYVKPLWSCSKPRQSELKATTSTSHWLTLLSSVLLMLSGRVKAETSPDRSNRKMNRYGLQVILPDKENDLHLNAVSKTIPLCCFQFGNYILRVIYNLVCVDWLFAAKVLLVNRAKHFLNCVFSYNLQSFLYKSKAPYLPLCIVHFLSLCGLFLSF